MPSKPEQGSKQLPIQPVQSEIFLQENVASTLVQQLPGHFDRRPSKVQLLSRIVKMGWLLVYNVMRGPSL
jgi:hypothetical protein